MDRFQKLSDLFKVLSHPARLAILSILQNGEQCVCHIEAILGLRQAYISQQLTVLRQAGFIEDRRDGWNIYYRVIKPEVYDLLDQVGKTMGETFMQESSLPRASACPCPKCNPPAEAMISTDQIGVQDPRVAQ